MDSGSQGASDFYSLDSGMKCLTLGPDVATVQSGISDTDLVLCPLCSWFMQINNDLDRDIFLNHLLVTHSLVISYVSSIASLQRYMDYWKRRFEEVPYQSVCSVIPKGSCSGEGEACPLFLLDGKIPEDNEIRKTLQQERLRQVLLLQEEERNDTTFSRECLFCRKHFSGNRFSLFQHLIADHHLHIGAPDNIVFGNEFLDVLEEKLKKLQCFYCEKTFKDWGTLKEHMRKKQHKRINPKNRAYDKFYLVNYLELGKTWEDVQNEDDNNSNSESEEREEIELMDCQEESYRITCLFCKDTSTEFAEMVLHMKDIHNFDFYGLKCSHNLDFYQQVKLVNYIRKQMHDNACTFCDDVYDCYGDLMKHMMGTGHISLFPDSSRWDQPMYYFPTYENDNFLCALEDPAEDIDSLVEVVVPEDAVPVPKLSFLCDEKLRNSLM